MPYITQERRKRLDPTISTLTNILSEGMMVAESSLDGQVNYVITRMLATLYTSDGYFDLERAIGILECAKLEFYRRAVAPYEDKKKEENGDVYGGVE